jgi:hypothetical protein
VGPHVGHDPLLGAAGAAPDPEELDEPDEPDEPDGPEEPPDEPEDEDDVDAGATLVTGPPLAGATGTLAAPGTYLTVTRVTYGRSRSGRPRSERRSSTGSDVGSLPDAAPCSAAKSAATTPASQPVVVRAPTAPMPVTAATARRPRSRSLLV